MLYQVLSYEVLNEILQNVYEWWIGKLTALSWHTPGMSEGKKYVESCDALPGPWTGIIYLIGCKCCIHLAQDIKTLTYISRLLVHRVYSSTTKTEKAMIHTWGTTAFTVPLGMITATYKVTTACTPMTYSSTLWIHIRCNTQPSNFQPEHQEF
jgi:hypothetical protein